MASTVVDNSPSSTGLIHLLKDISSKFSPEESEDVVQSLKRIYGERFSSLENQDLASCLDLLHKLGYVSNTKLTLIKEFVAPKSNKEKDINDAIDNFRASHPPQVELENELEGRSDDFMRITEKLLTGRLPVINLYGSAGLGKTTLAKKVCAEWQGKSYVIDLREAGDMRAIYRNIMNTLKLTVRESCIDMSFVVEKITENVRKISDGQPVLFLLDNVEQFTAGQGKEGRNLRTAFKQFLMELSEFNDTGNIRALNILLTSRTRLNDEAKVEDFELKSLRDSFSEKLLLHRETSDVNAEQKEKLLVACKGTPLLLKGVAAILRQERKAPSDLITELEKVKKDFGGMIGTPIKSKEEEDAEEKPVNLQEEDIDEGQLSLIKEMFNTLPSDSLKMSAVSISLIRGPFSTSTVAKVLDISLSEAVGQLEGLAASAIIDVVNQEAKELMYDIHPLLRKYADSIKNDAKFSESYIKAKKRFVKHFISKMIEIARFIEIDFLQAFEMFASDRSNYEFVVEISLLPEYFSVGSEFHDIALIASVLNDMLPNEKQMELFHSWAEMCEDDGKSGSLLQAYFRCWEARQVLDIGGSYKAFEILQQAASSLEQVQDQSTESFKLTQGLLFYFKGEIHCQNRDYNKALEWLQSSLNLTEKLLGDDTNVARCYNAIGNCYYGLEKPKKALEFYTKGLEMRKKLSGSEKHYDMPVYKNQIGTVHEDLGEYEEAVKWYKDALKLLEELKISGYEDKGTVYENQKQAVKWYKDAPGIIEQLKLEGEALFCRNLANVYAKQGKFKEAIEPAEKAYNIRIKRLGKHPDTVRSIYQQGVIQANLRDFDKALQLFRGAWEMEKSLEPGNHSPILRSIIKGVSDMCVTSEEREKFRQEALTNCKRFWREEKSSPVFSFTAELSKDIIDTIMGLLGDNEENRARKKEYEEEALWFYDGMQSATEEGFYNEFDQETDNYELNELLRDRDELLDMIIDLCVRLNKQVKLNKQRRNKMKLYKKILLRVDFVGAKGQEKVTLKRNVEQLYQDLGEKKSIPRFRENLLSTWQAQWEESKDGQESEEIMLARERMIKGIHQLCQELKKEELRRKYVKEALTFNERLWEVKHSQMKRPKMKKFLREIKDLASSVGDHDRVKLYHGALQSLQDGKQPDTLLSSKGFEEERVSVAEQFPSAAEDKCAELEEEVEVDSEDNEDTAPEKTLIKRSKVTVEGDTWYLKEAAACITFHSGAVTESSLITCSLWSPRALSPLLYSNEALVSNVIELSHDNSPDLMSSGNTKESVTVALLHSASELKGYELVIKQLVDPDHNEWRDLKTNNIWHSSEGVPNWLIPFAEAPCRITRHSSFAVIWRLKSFHFSRHTSTSPEFTCVVPEYPDASVTIPCNSVPADQDFRLTIKVQEFPSSELKVEGMLAGPVLHISCSQNVELLDPATIKVPLTLREDKRALGTDLSTGYVRVLHLTTKDRSPEWTEITEELESKAVVNNGIVTLQVKHFCRFALLVDWLSRLSRPVGILKNLYRRLMLQRAKFVARLCRAVKPGHYLLTLCCYPIHLDASVNDRFHRSPSTYTVDLYGEEESETPLCSGDKVFGRLLTAFTVQPECILDKFSLVFRGTGSSEKRLPVSIGVLRDLQIDFFKQEEATEKLCTVFMIGGSPVQVASFDYTLRQQGEVLALQTTTPQEVPEQRDLISTSASLKVTLLGSEWGSSAGGLSTLNRELAIHLSQRPKVKVSFFVPEGDCKDEDKREAQKYHITVVDAKKRPGYDPLDWLSFPPEDLSMDIVVGHGKKLGKQGQVIRERNHSCKWVQVVHTAPEDLAKYKSYPEPIAEGEKKHEVEIDLCKLADLVVPVGPRLEGSYSSYLGQDKDLFPLTPGLFKREFGDLQKSPKETSHFKVLLCCRGDDEDFELKGCDIAAKAFANELLKGEPFQLLFVGAPDGKQDEIMKKLLEYGIAKDQLFVRSFTENREKMKNLLREVDLAIMPSKTEGFGLVALEALSAGLPILVGSKSGFAAALRNLPKNIPLGECIVDSDDPTKWAEEIYAVRDKHGERLEEIRELRTAYEKEYSWEKQCKALVEKMWTMVHGAGSF